MIDIEPHDADDAYADARQRMVEDIRAMADETADYPASAIPERVLEVMGKVPRHRFVPDSERYAAYYNHPLPIGHGQTISQPYIVALMSGLLELTKAHRVLEVGTGCGYQTAVLSELAGEVYSVEIVAPLAERAAQLLRELGYANVEVKTGDGHAGWPEHAPYDAIIVTAAPDEVPRALIDQLKPGGRLAIPVGEGWYAQELMLIAKDRDGASHRKDILPVRFVPLTGNG
jgi:protein-L-isoaspartate(D-aspartate) O-methyltransferase